ncbi:MAG: zinc dependent phospholipase C family protein [Proteobacteria bacterium]|jgi:hypothetical protein|nr:zinc dependent phospholipase C family protein [Pseudomonadota bacterium]
MAGTLLHVTLATRAAEIADDAGARAIARRHPHDYALGAVLVDLPYYDRLARTALRLALGRPLRYHPFGAALHRRSPAGLCLALLETAKSPAERAVALGALTHHAVDLAFHPEIERRVRDSGGGGDLDGLHKRIEDDIDLHCHYDLLGTSGIGTGYARRALLLEPESDWTGLARAAMLRIHGEAPAAAQLSAWRSRLALFGLASSRPGIPWVRTLPADDPDLLERSIALADEAIATAAAYIACGARVLSGSTDRGGFFAVVKDVSILDGGAAEPAVPG